MNGGGVVDANPRQQARLHHDHSTFGTVPTTEATATNRKNEYRPTLRHDGGQFTRRCQAPMTAHLYVSRKVHDSH